MTVIERQHPFTGEWRRELEVEDARTAEQWLRSAGYVRIGDQWEARRGAIARLDRPVRRVRVTSG